MLKVIQVIVKTTKHLLHSVRIAIIESGIACYARTNLIQERIAWIMLHNLIYEELTLWAVSYKRHITTEHIP